MTSKSVYLLAEPIYPLAGPIIADDAQRAVEKRVLRTDKEISAELAGLNRKEQIFEFDVYRAETDEVLASYDVKDGYPYCFSLIEENGLQKESWPETADEVCAIADSKKYFELVEGVYLTDTHGQARGVGSG